MKGTMCDTMDPQSTLKSPCRKTHLQTIKCCVPPGWLRTYQCGIPSPLPPTDKPKWPRNRESTLTEFLQSEKIIRGSSHPLGYRNLERVCGGTSDYGKRVVFGIYFYIYVTTIISVFVPGQSRVIQKLNYYFSFCPRSVWYTKLKKWVCTARDLPGTKTEIIIVTINVKVNSEDDHVCWNGL